MLLGHASNPLTEVFDAYGGNYKPTRITATCSTLLDPIYVSNADSVLSAGTCNADNIGDHRLTFCNIKLPGTRGRQRYVTFRTFKDFDNKADDLSLIQWNDIYYMQNIEDKVHFLMFHLMQLFETHASFRIVRVNRPSAPWLTPALEALMREMKIGKTIRDCVTSR